MQKTRINSEWPKLFMLHQHLLEKDWNKFRVAKIRHSKFIQTFLVQKDWNKFGTAKIRHSKFIQTFLVQKDWKKFGMAKVGHSKFFKNYFGAKCVRFTLD